MEFKEEPVTWQEAMEAWERGKTIWYTEMFYTDIFTPPRRLVLRKHQKIYGTWYVEK